MGHLCLESLARGRGEVAACLVYAAPPILGGLLRVRGLARVRPAREAEQLRQEGEGAEAGEGHDSDLEYEGGGAPDWQHGVTLSRVELH